MADNQPNNDAPASASPEELLVLLRRDVRMLAISQFVSLFQKHQNIDFSIQALEADLSGSRPLSAVPNLLGKLLQTLAGDRHVNHTNWLPALRRAYVRRIKPEYNPFVKLVDVPAPEAEAGEGEAASADTASAAKVEASPTPAIEPVPAESEASVQAVADVVASEGGAAEGAAAAPAEGAPLTEANVEAKAEGDVFAAMEVDALKSEESASTIAVNGDAPKAEDAADPVAEAKPATTQEKVNVDWADVTFDQKVQAIYNVCEWHMDEPHRFRSNLKDNDDLAWRVQPIGSDANNNKYFHLLDNRLWVQRAPPTDANDSAAATDGSAEGARGMKRGREEDDVEAPVKIEEVVSRKRARRQEEVWEEIPAELLEEWKKEDAALAPVEEAANGEVKVEEEPAAEEEGEDEVDERPEWEQRYWAEFDRVAALKETDGFVEWEAVCLTAQQWQDFPTQFADSQNSQEQALVAKVTNDILPTIVPILTKEEKARAALLAEQNRKRSSRVAMKESAADEARREAREKEEAEAKASRASRHRAPQQAEQDEDEYVPQASHESRQDRLRKREEARVAAEEQAAVEESREIARAATAAQNGGYASNSASASPAPERKGSSRQAEMAAAEALLASAAPTTAYDEGEDPWYLACEVCGAEGWNLDDGSELISCDRCDEWQHLQCQKDRDAAQGRPPVDYESDDLEFICALCQRNPKRIPNRGQPPPRRSPAAIQQQQQYAAQQAKAAAAKKATPPPKKAAPPPKKAAAPAAKPPLKGRKSSTGQQAYGNGYGSPASGSQTPTGLPGAGQPPLDYESLKRLIAERPVLVNQLPPAYQDHFRQVLGIPVPYPM